MKRASFHAVCPYEIGDKIALGPEDGEKTLLTITDICAMHFLTSGEVKFIYQLDYSTNYVGIEAPVSIETSPESYTSKVIEFKKRKDDKDD